MSDSDNPQNVQVFSVGAQVSSILRMKVDAAARLRINREPILAKLKELRATSVTVTYSGSGDSGQIDDITVYRGKTELKSLSSVTVVSSESQWDEASHCWIHQCEPKAIELPEALEEFVYDWLEATHPGWENNDGADGEFTIDVAKGTLMLGHWSHYTESTHTEHRL